MKHILAVLVMVTCVACSYAGSKQQILVVKSSDIAKVQKYTMMSPADLKILLKDIKAETRVHNKALTLAEKEWRKDENLAKKPFPRAALALRKASVMGKYTTKEKAQKKLDSYTKKSTPKKKKKSKRHNKRNANKKIKKKSKSELAKEIRAKEKKQFADQARALYKIKQAELLGISTKPEADADKGIDEGVDQGVDP